ncbi:MAG: E2/UBC family protein [Thermodesulfobacteriota bacterium]
MKPWWQKWPGRLRYELDELKRAGIHYEIDRDSFRGRRVVSLRIRLRSGERELSLVVVFPDSYPYMRFEVYARELSLEHHQNPFQKNLCMIGRSTANWKTTDTVASFLTCRLPTVISAGASSEPERVKTLEEKQGEPVTYYYPYLRDSSVLTDTSWSIDSSVDRGILLVGVERQEGLGLRGAVLAVKDYRNNLLAQAMPELGHLYPVRIEGKWLRLERPLLEDNPARFWERLVSYDGSLVNPRFQALSGGRKVAIVGVLFPEEVGWRRTGSGWVFLVVQQMDKRG